MLSDEEKRAIEILNRFNPLDCGMEDRQAIDTILNLIEKQSKEIEELKETLKCTQNSWYEDTQKIEEMKKQIDLDNECEIALNSKIMDLEKEIEELKEQCKEVVCIPEGTCFMLEPKNVDKKWEDKIKAKIEELENQKRQWIEDRDNKHKDSEIIYAIEVLQSLLEKE